MADYVDPFEAFKQKKHDDDEHKEAAAKQATAAPREDGKPAGFEDTGLRRKPADEIKDEIKPPEKMETHHFGPDYNKSKLLDASEVGGDRIGKFTKDQMSDHKDLEAVEVQDAPPPGMESHIVKRDKEAKPETKPGKFRANQIERGEGETDVEEKKPAGLTRY